MQRIARIVAVALLSLLALMLPVSLASPANAANTDTPHLMIPDTVAMYPDCTAHYRVTKDAELEYGSVIADSLPRITAYTGIVFKPVVKGGEADITFKVGNAADTFSGDKTGGGTIIGWADSNTGIIMLVPSDEVNGYLGGSDSEVPRINLITHETLHIMGLDHDTTGSEIMNPLVQRETTKFGTGDLAGMEFIRKANSCSLAGIPVPPEKSNARAYSALERGTLIVIASIIILGIILAMASIIASILHDRRMRAAGAELPPAGWLLDPFYEGERLRYWDGTQWTKFVSSPAEKANSEDDTSSGPISQSREARNED